MASLANKFWNMINMNGASEDPEDEYLDDYVDEVDEEGEDEGEVRSFFSRKSSKVQNIGQQVKVVISQPTAFEQSSEICDLLKERKSIIINLEYVNKDVARRIIDVVSGAVLALDGHMQKVSNSIFLIAPYNYDITLDADEETKSKLQDSWFKTK